MPQSDAEKWNAIYSKNEFGFFPPATVLHHNQHLLPLNGKALDLACGHGRNAVHLCRQGLETFAYDISSVALEKLDAYAELEKLKIETRVFDIKQDDLQTGEFDVIVISHYLDRSVIENIKNALKQNGLIFYQTFTLEKLDDIGPSNPDYLLKQNELLNLFSEFTIHFYREDALTGDIKNGQRNEAMLVAQKP